MSNTSNPPRNILSDSLNTIHTIPSFNNSLKRRVSTSRDPSDEYNDKKRVRIHDTVAKHTLRAAKDHTYALMCHGNCTTFSRMRVGRIGRMRHDRVAPAGMFLILQRTHHFYIGLHSDDPSHLEFICIIQQIRCLPASFTR
jgi:hypothetical protein